MNWKMYLKLGSGLVPMMWIIPLCNKIGRMCPSCYDEHRVFFTALVICTTTLVAVAVSGTVHDVANYAEKKWIERRLNKKGA